MDSEETPQTSEGLQELLTHVAEGLPGKHGRSNVSELVREWKKEIAVYDRSELKELVQAKNTWASIAIHPLAKARLERHIIQRRSSSSSSSTESSGDDVELSCTDNSDENQELAYGPFGDCGEEADSEEYGEEDDWDPKNEAERLLTIQDSKIVAMIEVFQTALTIYVCAMYVWSTYYRHSRPIFFDIIFFVVGLIFLVGFVFNWIICNQKLRYFVGIRALLDYTTIPQLLIPFIFRWDGLNWAIAFVAVRTYRIVSALRILGNIQISALRNDTINAVIIALSLMFFAAGVFVYAEDLLFHNSFYFIVVSFTTVGYGTISPLTFWGRFAAVCFLFLTLVEAGLQAGLIADNLRRGYTGSYRRGYSDRPPFVLLVGDIQEASVRRFLREFYDKHNANSSNPTRVVILNPGAPSAGVRTLVDTIYRGNVKYFAGSPTRSADLDRVCAKHAEAIFVVSDRGPTESSLDQDKQALLSAMAIRKYRPRAPTIVQLHKAHHLRSQFLKRYRHLLCGQDLKCTLFAKNIETPGVSTLLSNLIRCPKKSPETRQRWQKEYLRGENHCVYRLSVPRVYRGHSFGTVASFIFEKHGAMVLGVKEKGNKVELNPVTRTLRGQETLFILSNSYKKIRSIEKMSDAVAFVSHHKARHLDRIAHRAELNLGNGLSPTTKRDHDWQESEDSSDTEEAPNSYQDARLSDATHLRDHVIIMGSCKFLSYDIPTLQGANGKNTVIVMFGKKPPSPRSWKRCSKKYPVFYMTGSYIRTQDVERTGIQTARMLVITGRRNAMAQLDGDSVLAYHTITALRPSLDLRFEITSGKARKFFQEDGVSESARLLPPFAAGQLFVASLIDRLTVQTYYNPDLLALLYLLVGQPPWDSPGSRGVQLLPIPESFLDRSFGELFQDLMACGVFVLGLYRYSDTTSLRYVSACPRADVTLLESDQMYVVFSNKIEE